MNELDRHFFWLVVGVFVCYLYIPVAGATACLVYAGEIVIGRFKCDADNRLIEMLPYAVTTVIALWFGLKKGT